MPVYWDQIRSLRETKILSRRQKEIVAVRSRIRIRGEQDDSSLVAGMRGVGRESIDQVVFQAR